MSGHREHAHQHRISSSDTLNRAFVIGVTLNLGFVGVEAVYGFVSHSVALLADAGHNLGDVLGLLVAWLGSVLVRRSPTPRFTYGLGSSSILAALFNALVLLVTVGAITVEAIRRLANPEPVQGYLVVVVAAVGILINAISAALFRPESRADLNIRAAFLHLAGDAVVSLGVAIAGLAIALTGITWIDSAVSLAVAVFLIVSTWRLLTQSFAMALHAVPAGADPSEIRSFLSGLNGVQEIHDFHIWSLSTTEIALTCHLVMPGGHPGDVFIARAADRLRQEFGIAHTTVQIETGEASSGCENACDGDIDRGPQEQSAS